MTRSGPLIVGAGLSGLVAGAYLARSGHEPLILEKSATCGGLAQSFEREGFTFDTGPRALGNAGILVPMLKDLGIDLPIVPGAVSIGLGKSVVHFDGETGIDDYLAALGEAFPKEKACLRKLGRRIRDSSSMTRVLNRLPNPYFRNPLADPSYLLKTFLPWLPGFLGVAFRTAAEKASVEKALASIGADASFRDMVSQHFFKGTPHHFAFGYFESFRDYLYPLGGTGALARALAEYIVAHGGKITTGREAMRVDPALRTVIDGSGEAYGYRELLWAADQRSFHGRLDPSGLPGPIRMAVARERRAFTRARAGESAFTVFLAVDESPDYFGRVSRGHFIHTPSVEGLGDLHRETLARLKAGFAEASTEDLTSWLREFCARSSYEISIPALKDPSLAPPGKTGLVASVLMDGEFWELAAGRNLAEELKEKTAAFMVDTLDASVYPGLKRKMRFMLSASPQSLMGRFGSTAGAITGWSLEAPPPVPSILPAIGRAVRTPVPHVSRAGQWSYSPSGVPVAILTGRIAAGSMTGRLGRARQEGVLRLS